MCACVQGQGRVGVPLCTRARSTPRGLARKSICSVIPQRARRHPKCQVLSVKCATGNQAGASAAPPLARTQPTRRGHKHRRHATHIAPRHPPPLLPPVLTNRPGHAACCFMCAGMCDVCPLGSSVRPSLSPEDRRDGCDIQRIVSGLRQDPCDASARHAGLGQPGTCCYALPRATPRALNTHGRVMVSTRGRAPTGGVTCRTRISPYLSKLQGHVLQRGSACSWRVAVCARGSVRAYAAPRCPTKQPWVQGGDNRWCTTWRRSSARCAGRPMVLRDRHCAGCRTPTGAPPAFVLAAKHTFLQASYEKNPQR